MTVCFLAPLQILTLKIPIKTTSENVVCWIFLQTYFCIQANSVDPDQTAPRWAVWSGSTLFAKMTFKITSRGQSRWQLLWLAVIRVDKQQWQFFACLLFHNWMVGKSESVKILIKCLLTSHLFWTFDISHVFWATQSDQSLSTCWSPGIPDYMVNVLKFRTPKFLTKCHIQTMQTQIRLTLQCSWGSSLIRVFTVCHSTKHFKRPMHKKQNLSRKSME